MSSKDPFPGATPVQVRAANLQVYDQIRDAIASGRFNPGDTLSTRQVAESLGVSQMPVREAFHRLVAEGALQNRSNRTIGLPLLGLSEFRELTEIRVTLEGEAAAKAAVSNAPIADELSVLLDGMESAIFRDDTAAYLALNRKFHFTVYSAAGSTELVRLIDQLWLRVGSLLNWSSRRRDNIVRSNVHHIAILQAVQERNPDRARRAIRDDLMEAATIVEDELGSVSSDRQGTVVDAAADTR